MALSMDEQRVLAEIERRLAADDPGLATCLTSFRRPGPATVLRSPRARIVGSLFTVLLVAMVSLMVYAMIPFRTHGARTSAPSTGTQSRVAVSATGTIFQPQKTQPATANGSTGRAGLRSPGRSVSASASANTGSAVGAGGQAAGQAIPPGGP